MRGSGVGEDDFPHTRAELFFDVAVLAGHGKAGRGRVRQGGAWQSWCGEARLGAAWRGAVGRGSAVKVRWGESGQGTVW